MSSKHFDDIKINFTEEKKRVEKELKKSRQWSSTVVARIGHLQKPKALSQRSEPRGWRRWSREALFQSAAPCAATGRVL